MQTTLPKERPLHSLFLHIGLLAGLGVFLNHLWHQSALESAILASFGTGMAIYLVLMAGTVMLQRILVQTSLRDPTRKASPASDQPSDAA
jgi:hypothetical protein